MTTLAELHAATDRRFTAREKRTGREKYRESFLSGDAGKARDEVEVGVEGQDS